MPDGVIVRNVPDGMSKEALLIKYNTSKYGGAQIGPVTGRDQIPGAGMAQAAAEAQKIEGELPLFERFSRWAQENPAAMMGGAGSVMTGGASLPVTALVTGGFGGAGELARQKMADEPVNLGDAGAEGAKQVAGVLIGGGIIKGLGALSKKLFSSPMQPEVRQAANYAADEGIPFPLSSAMPGSGAARAQQGSGILIPGYIRNASDATKVAQALNQRIGTLTQKAEVFDEAALQGQKFLKDVFDPGEQALRQVFADYKIAVGPEAQIEINATKPMLLTLVERMRARGETTSKLYRRIKSMVDPKGPGAKRVTYSAQEMDDLLRGVTNETFVKGTTWAEEGKALAAALVKDMDAYGQNLGLSFADDYATAAAGRAEYRELRKIPGLQQLAKEFGSGGAKKGSIDWMNSLFRAENAKALAKIRELNPSLYHDLSDAWLARQIQQFSSAKGEMLPTLNGAGLRTWFEQNSKQLQQFMTKEQLQALDNFSLYAKYMTGAQTQARAWALRDPQSTAATIGRGAAEVFGALKGGPVAPLLIGGEAGSFVLARGLSDPSSSLFKAFTTGFSPQFRSFIIKSGQLTGQQTGAQN